MALCTVDYVKNQISTGSLSDADISDLIDDVTSDILAQCGTTLGTNPLVILAGKNAILAATLRKLKTTGELAASVSTANAQRQNTTDKDIDFYQKKAESYIKQYQAASSYSFSSPSLHIGFSHHHHGGNHGHY